MKEHKSDDSSQPHNVWGFIWEDLNDWGYLEYLNYNHLKGPYSHVWHLGWDD
jgi:hypothetical protein